MGDQFQRPPDDMERFTLILDEVLREINSDYDAKRYKDVNSNSSVVYPVAAGFSFLDEIQRKVRRTK